MKEWTRRGGGGGAMNDDGKESRNDRKNQRINEKRNKRKKRRIEGTSERMKNEWRYEELNQRMKERTTVRVKGIITERGNRMEQGSLEWIEAIFFSIYTKRMRQNIWQDFPFSARFTLYCILLNLIFDMLSIFQCAFSLPGKFVILTF